MLKKGSDTNIFVSPTGLEMNRSKSVVSINAIEEKIFETLASMNKPVTTYEIDNKSTAGATTPTTSLSEKNKRRNIKHKSNKSNLTEYTIGSYQLLPTTANLAIVGFIDIDDLTVSDIHVPIAVQYYNNCDTTYQYDTTLADNINSTTQSELRIVLDSGASCSISGNPDRLKTLVRTIERKVQGVTGALGATKIGLNNDGVREMYVPGMTEGLILLCLRDYASKGGVWLHDTGGTIYSLTPSEQQEVARFMGQFQTYRQLKVDNGIYVINDNFKRKDKDFIYSTQLSQNDDHWDQVACLASTFRNGLVDFDSVSSRILGLMLMGLSFKTILQAVLHQSIGGVPPSITVKSLRTFAKHYGQTPDIVQQSLIHQLPNKKAFDLESKEKPTKVGDRIEIDFANWDANERVPDKLREGMEEHLVDL
jgi:hypothetical protein